jgi:hypothetical protein
VTWERYALIATQDKKDQIINKLKDYEYKKLLSERDGKLLFGYEGRCRIDLQVDTDKTLSLRVDDEDNYCVQGNLDLASTFKAGIEIVIGYSIRLPDKKKLEKHAEGKILLNEISDLCDAEEADAFYNCRFDVSLDKKPDDLVKRLIKLAGICEELEIEHRVTVFEDGYCEVLGALEDVGLWIGPSAYIIANWEEHSLVINSAETLFDDNNLFQTHR